MKNYFLVILIAFVLASCGFKTDAYYFELSQFEETKVYHFKCAEDSTYDLYWEIKSDLKENTLATVVYDYEFQKSSKMIEKFTDEGSKLISFIVYSNHFEEESADVYEIKEDDLIRWSTTNEPMIIRMVSKGSLDFSGEMKRERTFIDRAHIDVLGDKHEVIGFRDEFTFNKTSISFVNNMFFAKGLGLVAIETEEEGSAYVRTLQKILTQAEFDQLRFQ